MPSVFVGLSQGIQILGRLESLSHASDMALQTISVCFNMVLSASWHHVKIILKLSINHAAKTVEIIKPVKVCLKAARQIWVAVLCMTIRFFLAGKLRTDFAEERQDMPRPAHNKLESLHTCGKVQHKQQAGSLCCLLSAQHDRQRSMNFNSLCKDGERKSGIRGSSLAPGCIQDVDFSKKDAQAI